MAPLPLTAQKTAFIVLGVILSLLGLISTFLFQQISKKDNDLRQRGRYLVTIQGYSETIFLTFMLYNGAFSGSIPCFVMFQGTYASSVPIGLPTFFFLFKCSSVAYCTLSYGEHYFVIRL